MGNGGMGLHQKSPANFTATFPKNVTSQRHGGRTCGTTGVTGLAGKFEVSLASFVCRGLVNYQWRSGNIHPASLSLS